MDVDKKSSSSSSSSTSSDALEGFLSLARSAKGAQCAQVIKTCLKAKALYVFGELLEIPSVMELGQSDEYRGYLELLRIFAYGTYSDYASKQKTLPFQLQESETRKLKQLTLVGMAAQSSSLSYDDMLRECHLRTTRELEDLLIDAIYQGLVQGRMDQRGRKFHVTFAMGRDIGPADIDAMLGKLDAWDTHNQRLIGYLNDEIQRASDIVAHREAQREAEQAEQKRKKAGGGRKSKREESQIVEGSDDDEAMPDVL